MLRDILELRDQSNAELLEGIRHDASMDYQNRIPDATRVGMREVMEALGMATDEAIDRVRSFREHNIRLLELAHPVHHDEEAVLALTRRGPWRRGLLPKASLPPRPPLRACNRRPS